MPVSRWRLESAAIIRVVLLETQGQEEKAIRKALIAAYPFGERKMHPYKIWRSEVAIQRGVRKTKRPKAQPTADADEKQLTMLDE